MALEDVTLEIKQSAEQTRAKIMAEADEECRKILEEADRQISTLKAKEDKKLAESIERLERQELSSAELESKKIVLVKKKEILAKTFAETLEELESASDADKTKVYKKMVEATKGEIDSPTVYVPSSSKATAKGLGAAKVQKSDNLSSGVIIESEDGTLQIDMQYSTILQAVWDEEMKALTDILFGE